MIRQNTKTKGQQGIASRIKSGKQASQEEAQPRKRTCTESREKGHNM